MVTGRMHKAMMDRNMAVIDLDTLEAQVSERLKLNILVAKTHREIEARNERAFRTLNPQPKRKF